MYCKVLIININLTNSKILLDANLMCIFVKTSAIMRLDAKRFNKFLFFKLPSAFICGVRVKQIDTTKCMVSVTHRWINQNPFNSMYFAVQAMAAELTTGALMMLHIKESGKKISMLVAHNKSEFTKKATGRITFTCNDGNLVQETIQRAIETGEGQTCWLKSIGINEQGVQVSELDFEWSVKVK